MDTAEGASTTRISWRSPTLDCLDRPCSLVTIEKTRTVTTGSWDIKGRQAGLLVRQWRGGKHREAAASETSVGGNDVA
jgi:hypothetical protein